MTAKTRFAWSRNRQTGRHLGPTTYTLRRGGVDYAMVQEDAKGWFAYGFGAGPRFNTHAAPTTLEAAKADALARVRAAMEND